MAEDNSRWLQVLGLQSGATPDEIRRVYRDLVQVWHPDRFRHNERLRLQAQEKLKEINDAYDKLKRCAPSPEQGEAHGSGGASHRQAGDASTRATRDAGANGFRPRHSINSLYAPFRFLRNESVSTALQRTEQQRKLDGLASTFVGGELELPARVTDVRDGIVGAVLDVSKQYHDGDCERTYTLLHCDLAMSFEPSFRDRALTLRIGDHVTVLGTVIQLRVKSRANAGGTEYPVMEATLALAFLAISKPLSYEVLEASLRSPKENIETQAKAERDYQVYLREREIRNTYRTVAILAIPLGIVLGGMIGGCVGVFSGGLFGLTIGLMAMEKGWSD